MAVQPGSPKTCVKCEVFCVPGYYTPPKYYSPNLDFQLQKLITRSKVSVYMKILRIFLKFVLQNSVEFSQAL